jgi:pimeloyl-ACP methyl ester carboxylesterase
MVIAARVGDLGPFAPRRRRREDALRLCLRPSRASTARRAAVVLAVAALGVGCGGPTPSAVDAGGRSQPVASQPSPGDPGVSQPSPSQPGGSQPSSDEPALDLSGFEAAAGELDRARITERGPVTVAGRTFFTACVGSGPPWIMLVSGHHSPLNVWNDVQRRLGSAGRVCAYNRLGLAGSDPVPPEPQTFEGIAEDLDGLVTALDLGRPLIVVGHSLGGPIAMTWAAAHPDDTRGVVLVDASTPVLEERLAQLEMGVDEPLSSPAAGQALQQYRDDQGQNLEHLDLVRSWEQVMALPHLGDLPLIALVADPEEVEHPADLRGSKEEYDAAWSRGQQQWVALSDDGHLVEADGAGHDIQMDRPELVVAAVLALLEW